MSGVVRSHPSRSHKSTAQTEKTPRPPNAWILYRKDKAHQLPPPEPGQPRPAQAEVSKIVAGMWKKELEETRQEYERRAEEAKAEHALKYPGYRFKPMKKEQKRAQREQERCQRKHPGQRKSSGTPDPASIPPVLSTAPSLLQSVPVPMPMNVPPQSYLMTSAFPSHVVPVYTAQTRFGPAGPTPPVSAAASPASHNSSPPPDATCVDDQPQDVPTNINQSLDTTNSTGTHVPSVAPDPTLDVEAALAALYHPSFTSAAFASGQEWPQTPAAMAPNAGTLTPAMTPSLMWQEVDSNQQQHHADSIIKQITPIADQTTPADNFCFDVALQHFQDLEGMFSSSANNPFSGPIDNSLSGSIDNHLTALLNTTSDPDVFRLSQLTPQQLLSDPTNQIDILLGNFSPLDFTAFPPELFGSDLVTLGVPETDNPPAPDYNPDDYLDFGTSTGVPTPMPTPYVPPSGAANGAYRRVAGSWNKEFIGSPTPSP